MSSQHRLRLRYDLQTDCMITGADGRLVGSRTLDASWSGLRVAVDEGARVGERVQVALRIPRTSYWVNAEARVARLVAGRRAGEGGPSIGLELDRMNGMDRMLLADVLRRCRRSRAGRGEGRDYARAVRRISEE